MIEIFKYTHAELVEIAYKWVLKNGGVGFAFKELKSLDDEIPDVIGFNSLESILIEVKVSRSDFLADKKKPHRAKGMGNWRYFCCPKGLIKVGELPKRWGLIYVDERGKAKIEYDCRKKRVECQFANGGWRTTKADENRFDVDMKAERSMFYTALRRLFIKGYVKNIYDKDYNKSRDVNKLIMLNEDHNP